MFSRSATVPPGSSSSSKNTSFLADTSDHLWATAATPAPRSANGEYGVGEKRYLPGRLDPALMAPPRVVQGVPQVRRGKKGIGRKAVPSMLNPDLYVQPGEPPEKRQGSKLRE